MAKKKFVVTVGLTVEYDHREGVSKAAMKRWLRDALNNAYSGVSSANYEHEIADVIKTTVRQVDED